MWEQIRANKRNSIVLMGLMAVVLFLLGFLIGISFFGPRGGLLGVLIAVVVWGILLAVSFSSGDQILLASSKAQLITPDVHPMLFNVVEEMTIAAGLSKMPKVYIINDPAPNAFATGRKPETASVAVTAGLLGRLNRDELQGVIAHEMSHIIHRDILFVTLAGVMLGSIVLLSHVFLRGMFYSSIAGSRRRYSGGGRGGGQAQAIFLIIAILAAILAPIFAHILYFSLSRRREYLADAGGARLSRYPEGLASALEKISSAHIRQESANPVTAPMYISAPFKGKKAAELFSTHPSAEERIRILRSMGSGAGYSDYSTAYSEVRGAKAGAGVLPVSAFKDEEPVEIRKSTVSGGKSASGAERKRQKHETGDIMRKVNGFIFLTCQCGLKMKIPPNFRRNSLKCPRCGTVNKVR